MKQLIESLGAQVDELDVKNMARITPSEICPASLDPDLCRRIRASILVAGPIAARVGALKLPPPGGDVIDGAGSIRTSFRSAPSVWMWNTIAGLHFKLRGCAGRAYSWMSERYCNRECAHTPRRRRGQGKNGHSHNAVSSSHAQESCYFLNALGASIEEIRLIDASYQRCGASARGRVHHRARSPWQGAKFRRARRR